MRHCTIPRRFPSRMVALASLAALGGCGNASMPPGPPPPDASSYVVDAPAGDPGLRLDVTPFDDHAEVRVIAAGPIDVFGLSYRVRWDAARLRPGDVEQGEVLGGTGEAVMVSLPSEGSVALGGTRRSPDLGDRGIAGGTELAVLTLLGTDPGPGSVEVARVVARRSDGSYVPLGAERGTLTLITEAP